MPARLRLTATLRLLAVTFFVSTAYAQEGGSKGATATLSDAVAATKASFQPASESDLAAARGALDAAITDLERYLNANPTIAPGWKRYLQWDEMLSQLKAGKEAKASDLRGIALQYFADHVGLEMPLFAAVGKALRNYANVLYASREENLKEKYADKLDNVAKLLGAYAGDPSETNASNIASGLKFLARYGKPAKLLATIRENTKPNLFLRADEELIVHGVRRDLNEATPVNEIILGTNIRGTGHTIGRLDAELRPDRDQVVLDMMLRGTTSSRTVGTNRSALIYSAGNTTISGFKRLMIDERGITATPSTADAQTKSTITGIGSTRGGIAGCIVTRVASKRVAESKGQATEIASQRAEARIRQRLDVEAARQLEVSNRDLRLKFRDPLQRAGTYPQMLKFSSTDDDLYVVALAAGWTQLGAPNDPPSLAGDHDLVVVAHESVVNNTANTMFSGRTLHDHEIRNEIIRRRGSLPEDMKDDEDRDPWSISFVDDQPVHFQIADGGFRVLLKFRQFTSGERKPLKLVNVSAAYKAQKDGTQLVLVRQGDIVIKRDREAEDEKIPMGEVALRSILKKKFSKLFKDEIKGEGLEMPGKYKSLGKLPLGDYLMENGWVAIGWDMPPAKVALKQ